MTHPAVIAIADALAIYRALRLGMTHSAIALFTDKTVEEVHEWSDIFGTGPEALEAGRQGRPLVLPARGAVRHRTRRINRVTLA